MYNLVRLVFDWKKTTREQELFIFTHSEKKVPAIINLRINNTSTIYIIIYYNTIYYIIILYIIIKTKKI